MKSSRKKLYIGIAIVLVGAAVVYANFRFRRAEGKVVTVEKIEQRNLESVVSASGKVRAKRTVNISADTMGRVTDLAVNEGEFVKRGQFLLQIDPRNLRTAVQRSEASLAAAEAQLEQFRVAVATARVNLTLAQQTLTRQRELWSQQLTTKEQLDRAESEVKVRESDLREREKQVATQEQRIRQERAVVGSARYDLSKVRIESPIDGLVTRRNIEEGETVVIGTMNNAGTVLLTVADMSVIEAEIEVDETDIPAVRIGQPAKITIDAILNKTFGGKVTEIGNSPIQATTSGSAGQQATNFKVVVQFDDQIPDVRPGFTCTADITTATRKQSLAVPIQAMAVREMTFDKDGRLVRQPRDQKAPARRSVEPTAAASAETLPPGQTKKETEGVFLFRDQKYAEFVPVKTGIAGDKYFEVLEGLKPGEQVVTGPFNSVRDLKDGDAIRVEAPKGR